MKELRFYVPPRGLVCQNHRAFHQWDVNDLEDCEPIQFTASYIENMVDLLRFKPKKLDKVQSGLYSDVKPSCELRKMCQ